MEFGEISKNLYAKIRVPAESDYDLRVQRKKVLKEYNDLVMLWKHFQSFAGEFTISRPLDCIPECYTLITEGFVGKEVSEK